MFALAVIAETDLVSALPRRFVAMHAARFAVVALEPPLPLTRFRLNAVTPKVAMMDAGLAWIFALLGRVQQAAPKQSKHSFRRKRRS